MKSLYLRSVQWYRFDPKWTSTQAVGNCRILLNHRHDSGIPFGNSRVGGGGQLSTCGQLHRQALYQRVLSRSCAMEVGIMSNYSEKAQPYLDAIASGVFTSQSVRDWLIEGTHAEAAYRGAGVLSEEQKAVRWRTRPTKQSYWANYFCGRDSRCTCRIEGSKGLETDALFFLRNGAGRILAVHVEFKHSKENFSFGQAQSYPMRAACFVKTCDQRPTVNHHDDWTTVLFCGAEKLGDPELSCFEHVITHDEAVMRLPGYPR